MKFLVGCTPTPEGVAALLNSPVPVICVPGQAKTG